MPLDRAPPARPAARTLLDAVRLSKLLAFVLRHRPDALGIKLEAEGWVEIDELVRRLNQSRRLDAPIDRPALERFVAEGGGSRFEIVGSRVRARGGHTAPGIAPQRPVPAPPPDFLFFGSSRDRIGRTLNDHGLHAEPGRWLRLHESERAARRAASGTEKAKARVVVVEAQRASRNGVVFFRGAEAGVFLVTHVPRRYLLSERPGFERQVSAGVVLVRRSGIEVEIALIRTKPRGETASDVEPMPEDSSVDVTISHDPEQPSPLFRPKATHLPGLDENVLPPPRPAPRAESHASSSADDLDPRAGDRRAGEDRRREDRGPPDGIERRQSTRRRRRRRGGWGPEGRVELPKGKLEPGETAHQAAVRELREETGLLTPVDLVSELPRVRYAFRTPEGRSVFKIVHYFLLLSRDPSPSFVPQGKEGIVAVEWTPLRHALESIAFGNLRPVLEAARDALAADLPPRSPPPADEDDLFPD